MRETFATSQRSTPLDFSVLAERAATPQSSGAAPASPLAIDELLLRMRSGDRDAAATFLLRYGSRIRRRIRGKLGPSIRRLFDSMDILSTLGRRLDIYVMSGRMQVASEGQLWSLLFKMADNAMIDKARIFKRLQIVEHEDSEFAQDLSRRLEKAENDADPHRRGAEIEIDNCLRLLDDPIDRRILSLWLVGEPSTSIATHVEMSDAAVRKRWERIKSHLREKFLAGAA